MPNNPPAPDCRGEICFGAGWIIGELDDTEGQFIMSVGTSAAAQTCYNDGDVIPVDSWVTVAPTNYTLPAGFKVEVKLTGTQKAEDGDCSESEDCDTRISGLVKVTKGKIHTFQVYEMAQIPCGAEIEETFTDDLVSGAACDYNWTDVTQAHQEELGVLDTMYSFELNNDVCGVYRNIVAELLLNPDGDEIIKTHSGENYRLAVEFSVDCECCPEVEPE